MIITCEGCDTKFNLDDKLIKEAGSKVRCSQCGKVFTAYPATPPDDDPVPSDDAGLVPSQESIAEQVEQGREADAAVSSVVAGDDGAETDGEAADTAAAPEPQGPEETVEKADGDEDFDFSEIDDILDDQLALESDDDAEKLLEDLDLELENEPSPDTVDFDKELEEELDLSDLSDLLEEEGLDSDAGKNGDDLPEDLDLELALEDEETSGEALSGSGEASSQIGDKEVPPDAGDDIGTGDALEDLDLELDFELEAPEEGAKDQAPAEELDLSDLEDILEIDASDDEGEEKEDLVDDIQLTLDADMTAEEALTEIPDSSTDASEDASGAEVDLADIEEMLGAAGDEGTGDSAGEDLELELDLLEEEEAAPKEASEDAPAEKDADIEDFDLEFETLDDLGGETPAPEPSEEAAVSPDLSFPEEPPEQADLPVEDRGEAVVAETDRKELPKPPDIMPENAPISPLEDEEDEPTSAVKKKGLGLPVLLLILVALLAGGAYCVHQFMGVHIPYLSDFLKPAEEDKGSLKIKTSEIHSKFVDNQQLGRLFVITGKAKNEYPMPRSFIRIRGQIFQKGKKLYQTQFVYPGNIIAELQLKDLDQDAIKKRLSNRMGDNRSNVKLAPGRTLPFMIVFHDIPENLEEFTIEVVESVE